MELKVHEKLAEAQDNIEFLKNQNADLAKACEKLRAELAAFRKRLNITYDTAEGIPTGMGEDEIDRLNHSLSACMEEIKLMRKFRDELMSDNERLKEENTSLSDSLKVWIKNATQFKNNGINLATALKQAKDELKTSRAMRKANLISLSKIVPEYYLKAKEMFPFISHTADEWGKLSLFGSIKVVLEQAVAELAAAKTRIAELEEALTLLHDEKVELQIDVSKNAAELERVRRERDELRNSAVRVLGQNIDVKLVSSDMCEALDNLERTIRRIPLPAAPE